MTCLIALAASGFACERAGPWLFSRTRCVSAANWPASGMSTTCTEPRIIDPEYWSSRAMFWHSGVPAFGVRPPHGFGPAPDALVFVITRRFASGVTATAAGYHDGGMNPLAFRVVRFT